jgi:predicted component of type VI protein secretion system
MIFQHSTEFLRWGVYPDDVTYQYLFYCGCVYVFNVSVILREEKTYVVTYGKKQRVL